MNTCLQAVSTTIEKDKINNHVSLPVFMTNKRIFQKNNQLELTNVVLVNYETNLGLFLTCFINTR